MVIIKHVHTYDSLYLVFDILSTYFTLQNHVYLRANKSDKQVLTQYSQFFFAKTPV